MSLHLFTLAEKIEALTIEVDSARRVARPSGSAAQRQYAVLKAILADLKARAVFPRSQPLGELERALARMQRSKTALGYDEGHMVAVANTVINKWPVISQALEQFGEISAE